MDTAPGLQQRPIFGLFAFVLSVGSAISLRFVHADRLLLRNWLATSIAAGLIFTALAWAIPRFAPGMNTYLWVKRFRRDSVRFGVSVSLVSFLIAFVTILALVVIAQLRYPGMTAYWPDLWLILGASAIAPSLIAIYVGLALSGATRRLPWLDVGKHLLTASPRDFSDGGRLFVLVVAAISIGCLQGGIVLTGGLATSFGSYLLLSAATVAAITSERPAYAIFTTLLVASAGLSTEIIGSYHPPSAIYYPVAHLVMFLLALVVGLLVDLGRRVQPKPKQRTAASPNGETM